MKKLGIIIIVIGVIFILYPSLDIVNTWYWQNKLIKQWNDDNYKILTTAEKYELSEGKELDFHESPDSKGQNSEEGNKASTPKTDFPDRTIGIIEIDKINLKLPILEDVSNRNLKIGVAWMPDTSHIDEIGNTALSAHRSHTYGRLFNRLDEIKIGDEIKITTKRGMYSYIVYKTFIVDYTDVFVIKNYENEDIVTLITCHPLYKTNPNQRLIIQSRRK